MFHVKHEGWTAAELSLVSSQLSRPSKVSSRRTRSLAGWSRLPTGITSASGTCSTAPSRPSPRRHEAARDRPRVGSRLPGIPVAVARPDLLLTLAEPRQMRVAFLELVVERLSFRTSASFLGPPRNCPRLPACASPGVRRSLSELGGRPGSSPRDGSLIYWAGARFRTDQVPEDVRVAAIHTPTLESGGPIVIMTRQ